MVTHRFIAVIILLIKLYDGDGQTNHNYNQQCFGVYVSNPPNPKIVSIEYDRTINSRNSLISKIDLDIKTNAERYIIMKDCAMYMNKRLVLRTYMDSKGQNVKKDFAMRIDIQNTRSDPCRKGIKYCKYKHSDLIFMVYVYLKDKTFSICRFSKKQLEELINKEDNKAKKDNKGEIDKMELLNKYFEQNETINKINICHNEQNESFKNSYLTYETSFLKIMGPIMVNNCVDEAKVEIKKILEEPLGKNIGSCQKWQNEFIKIQRRLKI